MTKSIKKFTAFFCAALLTFAALCTSAFAAGTIDASVSGNYGDKDVTYTYTVNSVGTTASVGFLTTSTEDTYTLRFSPATGSSARIYFYDWYTHELLDSMSIPMYSPGMPASLSTRFDWGKNKWVYVKVKSNSSTDAFGTFTIEGVYIETYCD